MQEFCQTEVKFITFSSKLLPDQIQLHQTSHLLLTCERSVNNIYGDEREGKDHHLSFNYALERSYCSMVKITEWSESGMGQSFSCIAFFLTSVNLLLGPLR